MAAKKKDPDVFEKALHDFKSTLKKKDLDRFKVTTLEELLRDIENVQNKQLSQRRSKNLARLQPFLEAIQQFGKVIEVFSNASEFVAFVWGPLKFVLQIASSLADAFNELLGVYESLGEQIPQLLQYKRFFQHDANMSRVLGLLYKDILEFHGCALKYFQLPMWKQLFKATWHTYKTNFTGVIGKLQSHSVLIGRQATLAQIEDSRKAIALHSDKLKSISDTEQAILLEIEESRKAMELHNAELKSKSEAGNARTLRDIHGWLRAPNVENDHRYYQNIRKEFPESGKWVMEKDAFREWFDLHCPSVPPLLWLNGILGAGKTILASLIIEEAKNLEPAPAVLYFYCKSDDPERNNFASIGRSLLSQLLQHDKDILLPYYYDKYSNSADSILDTISTIEELLEVAIRNYSCVYVILDGIDECPRNERKTVATWFRALVDNLPQSNPDQVRVLFVSQDDGIARKDFDGLTSLKVTVEDIRADIENYSAIWAEKIQRKLGISEEMQNDIEIKIPDAADGMFLLAKLIATNLFDQNSIEDLEKELKPQKFPRKLDDAYSRIITRVLDISPSHKKDSLMLFTWLACARRSLKWHEIQTAKSINLEQQSVDIEKRQFRVDSKDLCGSLVEVRPNGTVELIHLSAKYFLMDNYVNPIYGNIQLAMLCVGYLNLPGFLPTFDDNVPVLIENGYYGFMDYAIPCWVRHLEAGSSNSNKDQDLIQELSETLDVFIGLHFASPSKTFPISRGNSARLQQFKHLPQYEKLQQAVISTRKQLTFNGDMKSSEIVLDLSDAVVNIRRHLEDMLGKANEASKDRLMRLYGPNLFKCPRLSCDYFSDGFPTAELRDRHLDRHERPFHCTVEGCLFFTLGFSSDQDLEKHKSETHGLYASQEREFPEDKDLFPPEPTPVAPVQEQHRLVIEQEKEEGTIEPLLPVPEVQSPQAKKQRTQQTFTCPHCLKTFTKQYNLHSHLITHTTNQPFSCEECGSRFARASDYNRHVKSHAEGSKFVCGGTLGDGTRWGCGKSFSRADTLKSHHRTIVGARCLKASLRMQPQVEKSSHP